MGESEIAAGKGRSKKAVVVSCAFVTLNAAAFLFPANFVLAQGSDLAAVEQKLFFKTYNEENNEARLLRIEKRVFGDQMPGNFQERMARVMQAAAPQVNPDGSTTGAQAAAPAAPPVDPAREEAERRQAEIERARVAALAAREQQINHTIDEGVSLWRAKQSTPALQKFEQALQMDPHNAQALYYLGIVHESRNDYVQALGDYRKASNEDPSNRDYAEAVTAVQKLMNSKPKVSPQQAEVSKLTAQAAEAYKRGEYLSAMDLYRQLDAKSPNNATVKYNLGSLYLGAKDPLTALEFYRQAATLSPHEAKFVQAYQKLKANVDQADAQNQQTEAQWKANGYSGDPNGAPQNGMPPQNGGMPNNGGMGMGGGGNGNNMGGGGNMPVAMNNMGGNNSTNPGNSAPGKKPPKQHPSHPALNQQNNNSNNSNQPANYQQGNQNGYQGNSNGDYQQSSNQGGGYQQGGGYSNGQNGNGGYQNASGGYQNNQQDSFQNQQNGYGGNYNSGQGQGQGQGGYQPKFVATMPGTGKSPGVHANNGNNQNQSMNNNTNNNMNGGHNAPPSMNSGSGYSGQQGGGQSIASAAPPGGGPQRSMPTVPNNFNNKSSPFGLPGKQSEANALENLGIIAKNTSSGVMISHVGVGSRASKAGLVQGDYIRALDGKVVNNITQVMNLLKGKGPDAPVSLHVQRKDQLGNVNL